jgi:hypothetical protein
MIAEVHNARKYLTLYIDEVMQLHYYILSNYIDFSMHNKD